MIRFGMADTEQEPSPGTQDIALRFVNAYIAILVSSIGSSAVQATVKQAFPDMQLLSTVGGKPTLTTDKSEILQKVIANLVARLSRDFGYEFSEQLFQRAYEKVGNGASSDEQVKIFAILPDHSLEQERAKLMSRGELEGQLINRTRELEKLNANLEQAVVERTKELAKANEELTRLNQAKTEFLSMVSHQLRTPLTAIKWTISEIKSQGGVTDEMTTKELGTVSEITERTLQLIADLLNVARIDEGRLEYHFERIHLPLVLDDVMTALKPMADEKGVALTIEGEQGHEIYGDKEKLYLVFENLVQNAIKYTPAQKKVSITTSEEGHNAVVKVADEGIGIPLAEQDKIFGRFFRASNTAKHQIDGTGLGLFIAKSIIETHHGRITFTSAEDSGTTFTVAVPILLDSGQVPTAETAARA